jgi:hypothetical protein
MTEQVFGRVVDVSPGNPQRIDAASICTETCHTRPVPSVAEAQSHRGCPGTTKQDNWVTEEQGEKIS